MHSILIKTSMAGVGQLIAAAKSAEVDEALVINRASGDRLIDTYQADFIIGVLNPSLGEEQVMSTSTEDEETSEHSGFSNYDVMLRVGMAVARDIPVFLVVPPPLIPPTVPNMVMVAPCPLDDFDSLRLHLWAFMAMLRENPRPRRFDEQETAKGANIDTNDLLRQLNSLASEPGPSIYAQGVEQLVLQLIREAGIGLAENPARGRPDAGFDMAVLASQASNDIVLIEVLAGHLTERRIHDAELRLQESVIGRRSWLGLLIYSDTSDRRYLPRRSTPSVVRVALKDLIDGLSRKPFIEILAEEIAKAVERI